MFTEIPSERPITPLLDSVTNAADLRLLAEDQLEQFNHELREYLLYSVGQSGGHFGAGLGVVELTVALHHVFDTPDDRIVWDVGHQAYPHKILTGRRDQMRTIRGPIPTSRFLRRLDRKIGRTAGRCDRRKRAGVQFVCDCISQRVICDL